MNKNKNNNKIVIVVNGAGGVGKDTVCEIISKYYKAKNISAIDPIKKIAVYGGWEYGDKSLKARKLLSDIKRAFIEYNDLPLNYLLNEYSEFINGENEILLVHIREPEEIEKFKKNLTSDCICLTLLITSNKSEGIVFGNASDDGVANYNYDYIYENKTTLDELEKDFMDFFEPIINKLYEAYNKCIFDKSDN